MAFAMMGGIIVGTLLTLLFLPAFYVASFRVKAPMESKTKQVATIAAPPQHNQPMTNSSQRPSALSNASRAIGDLKNPAYS